MTLSWDRKKKTKHTDRLNTHVTDFVEVEEFQLPENEPCAKDPSVYPTGEMWRDTVRRQLRFEALRLDIVTMQLSAPDQSGELQTVLVYGLGSPAPWEEVNALLCVDRTLKPHLPTHSEHSRRTRSWNWSTRDRRLHRSKTFDLGPTMTSSRSPKQRLGGGPCRLLLFLKPIRSVGQPQGETRGIDDPANRRIST